MLSTTCGESGADGRKWWRLTNRWSCRLKLHLFREELACRGSLRAGDAAAQLNSMLRTLGSQNLGYDLLAQTERGSYPAIPWGNRRKN